MSNTIAAMIQRPADCLETAPTYYVRPTGDTPAQHGLPTGVQRGRRGRYRAVIARQYTREFATIAETLEWRERVLAVLAIPLTRRSDDPETEAVRQAMLRGGLRALGL